MIRIVHISDIHWRAISRHKEYRQAFELLFEEVKKLNPDIIINTGDTYHTKVNISSEAIVNMAWMFEELGNIAPTYTILGNHDGNLHNSNRMDAISPIHKLIENPNTILLKESGVYKLDGMAPKVALCVFSIFDKANWSKVKPEPGYVNIALYHGSISGCKMDNDWSLPHGEQEKTFFKDFDYTLLGDIHKHQFLGERAAESEVVDEQQLKKYIELYGEENIEVLSEWESK